MNDCHRKGFEKFFKINKRRWLSSVHKDSPVAVMDKLGRLDFLLYFGTSMKSG
jgi:hypothetical protein